MRGTVGEFFIERLKSHNVNHVFGIPGDYTLSFFDELYKSEIRVVGNTNELCSGYAADAYARVHGIGCVCVTYCVGGFSVLNAVAGAYAERSPVIVISGSPGIKERDNKVLLHHMVRHFECQHQIFEPITCANTVLKDPEKAGYEIDRVLGAAIENKQPVYIEIPRDIVNKPIKYDPYFQMTPKDKVSDEQTLSEAVQDVVDYINSSKNPVIWAGVELSRFNFSKKLLKFAEATNIPVASTVLGKSVFSESHPLSLGVFCESIAPEGLKKFMDSCDCLIMLGVMMTDMNTGFLPLKYLKRNVVSASISSNNVQVRNHSYSDVKFVDFVDRLFKSKIRQRESISLPKREVFEFVARENVKIKVSRLFQKISNIVNENTAIVADIGDSLFGALDIPVQYHHFISNAFYASMGFAIPGAVGVSCARSNLRPIVVVGDGAFQMAGQEISTLVANKSNAIIFVLNNYGYGTERLILDGPFNDIPSWNYSEIVKLVGGGVGYKVNTEIELESAVSSALEETDRPSVIEVVLDKKDHTDTLRRLLER